jgi:hypothetical protein
MGHHVEVAGEAQPGNLAIFHEVPIAGMLSTYPNHVPDLFIVASPTNSQLPHQHRGPELLDVTL